MTTIRKADDEDLFFVFFEDVDYGAPLEIVDGPKPLFVCAKRTLETTYIFACCADQTARDALYEWIEPRLLDLMAGALLDREWAKCGNVLKLLTDCDFCTKVAAPKRKAG